MAVRGKEVDCYYGPATSRMAKVLGLGRDELRRLLAQRQEERRGFVLGVRENVFFKDAETLAKEFRDDDQGPLISGRGTVKD